MTELTTTKADKKVRPGNWHKKYLPFVAKSPDLQVDWLVNKLTALRKMGESDRTGLLTREELIPYIRILLANVKEGSGTDYLSDEDETLSFFLQSTNDQDILLMIECAEIYDIPKLFRILKNISVEQAVVAMKKVPPVYERNPLLVMDRVFHSIRGKSADLLEEAAQEVLASEDSPDNFDANYERFCEIVLDENILSEMYPKAR